MVAGAVAPPKGFIIARLINIKSCEGIAPRPTYNSREITKMAVRELPSQVKGARLRALSRRSP